MRQWIDLFEHRPAFLYHGTSLTMALEALTEDRLIAPISFTRDRNIAFKFAEGKSEDVLEIAMNTWPERFPTDDHLTAENFAKQIPTAFIENHFPTGGVVFALDPVTLRHNNTVRPYSDDPTHDYKWEREERAEKDIRGFKKHVKQVFVGRKFTDFAHFVLNGWDGHCDPQPQYREAIEFIRDHKSF